MSAGIIELVGVELERATSKFPTWPTDPLHALAVLGEEFGELTKAALQLTYEPHKTSPEEVATEAVQTAAMALRFAMSLGVYQYAPSEQHEQQAAAGAVAAIDAELLHRMSLVNKGVLSLNDLVGHFVRLGLNAHQAEADSVSEELF
jgi:hypothetical protein